MSGGGGQPSGAALAALISDNPQAGPALFKQSFEMQKQQADIGKLNAESLKARIDARTEQLKSLGNFAARAADNPTQENYVGVVSQLSHIGMPLDSFGHGMTSPVRRRISQGSPLR